MSLNPHEKLSPYWQRIVTEADKIVLRQMDEARAYRDWIAAKPSPWQEDNLTKVKLQWELEGLAEEREMIRKGGFWGKLWAAYEVLGEKPSLVFRIN